MVSKTYLKPTYLPTYVTVVTVVTFFFIFYFIFFIILHNFIIDNQRNRLAGGGGMLSRLAGLGRGRARPPSS